MLPCVVYFKNDRFFVFFRHKQKNACVFFLYFLHFLRFNIFIQWNHGYIMQSSHPLLVHKRIYQIAIPFVIHFFLFESEKDGKTWNNAKKDYLDQGLFAGQNTQQPRRQAGWCFCSYTEMRQAFLSLLIKRKNENRQLYSLAYNSKV